MIFKLCTPIILNYFQKKFIGRYLTKILEDTYVIYLFRLLYTDDTILIFSSNNVSILYLLIDIRFL